jgi:hypothetical protein
MQFFLDPRLRGDDNTSNLSLPRRREVSDQRETPVQFLIRIFKKWVEIAVMLNVKEWV